MKTNKISLSDVSIENNQEDLEKIKEFFLEKINADPEVQKIIKNLNVSKRS
ncbi:prepilin peptidase, partial [Mycoplasma hyorhinis]|nr:prepilin peptidase [Mesomycoplasma hyorhinis]